MNCSEVTEKLPWLLNQSLTGGERGDVITHLRQCESCRRELNETADFMEIAGGHPTPDRIAAYVFDSGLDEAERKSIEGHIAECASCRQEVQLAADSRRAMPQARRGWMPALGLAAMLVISVSLGMLWRGAVQRTESLEARTRTLEEQVRVLSRPSASVRMLDLFPDGLRERSGQTTTDQRVQTGAGQQSTLLFNSQIPMNRTGCALRLNRGDSVIWQAEKLERGADGEFVLHIPEGFMTKGAYRVSLSCDGSSEQYSFSIE